jgi:hypothetical protein
VSTGTVQWEGGVSVQLDIYVKIWDKQNITIGRIEGTPNWSKWQIHILMKIIILIKCWVSCSYVRQFVVICFQVSNQSLALLLQLLTDKCQSSYKGGGGWILRGDWGDWSQRCQVVDSCLFQCFPNFVSENMTECYNSICKVLVRAKCVRQRSYLGRPLLMALFLFLSLFLRPLLFSQKGLS